MAAALPIETRQSRAGETEKMTVNVGVVVFGHVDLLVQERFYSNRSVLVRTALRNQQALRAAMLKQTLARRTLVVDLQYYSRADLERALAAGERSQVQVLGLPRTADDVAPELARAAIESVTVLGAFQASPGVRKALSDRILILSSTPERAPCTLPKTPARRPSTPTLSTRRSSVHWPPRAWIPRRGQCTP